MTSVPERWQVTISVEEMLTQLRSATDDLVGAIGGLSDTAVRAPSLLPGWTRAHVLTHLARNAEGGTRLLGWARTGVASYEYKSLQARAAAIEEGSTRPAAVLIEDVRQAADGFFAGAARMPAQGWQRTVRWTAGQETPANLIVWSRHAEVLIHHVDLDIGYRPSDWPAAFVGDCLSRTVASLNTRAGAMAAVRMEGTDTGRVFVIGETTSAVTAVAGPEHELLAWLLGRSDGSHLRRDAGIPLPVVPAIY